ncbi:hypothetical protein FUT69_06505 [Xylella taiwanensis]|nr:hypothetical protein [Xylella taiwanensis]AXI83375.1 hypothetical protein AB672_05190 [Xylella taiwanensis]MCD8456441.1 hypothetical protein [Xylella taiwanensis]MCD8458848.1 hypothetical protein [Xylella taiwanensis]MCD8460985.1 hypothetical protein [Xylella taiwanensis]MCD8462954.1 hypothetical protein [Xylella taiwanensis]
MPVPQFTALVLPSPPCAYAHHALLPSQMNALVRLGLTNVPHQTALSVLPELPPYHVSYQTYNAMLYDSLPTLLKRTLRSFNPLAEQACLISGEPGP